MLSLIISLLPFFTEFNAYPTYQSFAIEDHEVVWEHVFENDSTDYNDPQHVFKQLKLKPWLENVRFDGEDVVAELRSLKVDYAKYGAKYLNTSTLIRTGRWDGKVRINFKNGKYRVIVYGLHYEAYQPSRAAGKVSFEAHNISGPLTQWALNDSRTSFRKIRFFNLDLLHFALRELFLIDQPEVIKENW